MFIWYKSHRSLIGNKQQVWFKSHHSYAHFHGSSVSNSGCRQAFAFPSGLCFAARPHATARKLLLYPFVSTDLEFLHLSQVDGERWSSALIRRLTADRQFDSIIAGIGDHSACSKHNLFLQNWFKCAREVLYAWVRWFYSPFKSIFRLQSTTQTLISLWITFRCTSNSL